MSKRTEYQLTFRALPGHPWTAEQRLKKLLKIAGRMLGMECTSAREVKPQPGEQAAASHSPAPEGKDASNNT